MERIQRANSGAPGEIGPGGEMGESSGQWKNGLGDGKGTGAKKRERWINGRGKRDGGKRSK